MTTQKVPRRPVAESLSDILASPEVSRTHRRALKQTRWTGRPGYPIRSMVGMALAKSLYALPTWTRTVALVKEHRELAAIIAPDGDVPSHWACYRFLGKLREHKPLLADCIASVVEALKRANPLLGWDVAIDASDMPAYANGQRFKSKNGPEREKYSDPDASWGHRSAVSTRKGGGFYGYRLHMAVCSKDRPAARLNRRDREEAGNPDRRAAARQAQGARHQPVYKCYDNSTVHDACTEREVLPVTPLRQTPAIKRGDHKPPCCEHGTWTFAGADRKRKATKWRCPTGSASPRPSGQGRRLRPSDPTRDGALERSLRRRAS